MNKREREDEEEGERVTMIEILIKRYKDRSIGREIEREIEEERKKRREKEAKTRIPDLSEIYL